MAAVTISIAGLEESKSRALDAFAGHEQGAFITFPTVQLLWKVITPKRWDLLRAMTGAGPLAIREVARRVGRDVKSVHGDISALLKAGIIDRTENGRIEFPYTEIHVDFVLRAA
jgi:predicted transcriptional regulator